MVLIVLSLAALALDTTSVMVVRLIRVLRVRIVSSLFVPGIHVKVRETTPLRESRGPQIVRILGKLPSLRKLITALIVCILPVLSAFVILAIFVSICELQETRALLAAHAIHASDVCGRAQSKFSHADCTAVGCLSHHRPAFAAAVLGAALFGEQAPDNFREFDRAFVTMFRIAGRPDVLHPLLVSTS